MSKFEGAISITMVVLTTILIVVGLVFCGISLFDKKIVDFYGISLSVAFTILLVLVGLVIVGSSIFVIYKCLDKK